MFYKHLEIPVFVEIDNRVLGRVDEMLTSSHLFFSHKTLVTSPELYTLYSHFIDSNKFDSLILVQGGKVEEYSLLKKQCDNLDTLFIAFGGGSILDIVKYAATDMNIPYIAMPSTLSNDAIYSPVARLTCNGKKKSFGVKPPIGIVVDLSIVKKSPKQLILAGVGDLLSNLSAVKDWELSRLSTGEKIDELSFMLAKEAAVSILRYSEKDLYTDVFLADLARGLITSGLSMIHSGNTRGTSGSEHLMSHAIDEYFSDKSTIHGIQVAWAHLLIEQLLRTESGYNMINSYFSRIGLNSMIKQYIQFSEIDFMKMIPLAKMIRNRYTVLNLVGR